MAPITHPYAQQALGLKIDLSGTNPPPSFLFVLVGGKLAPFFSKFDQNGEAYTNKQSIYLDVYLRDNFTDRSSIWQGV